MERLDKRYIRFAERICRRQKLEHKTASDLQSGVEAGLAAEQAAENKRRKNIARARRSNVDAGRFHAPYLRPVRADSHQARWGFDAGNDNARRTFV